MKKIIKSFTFWFTIFGIAVVIFNLMNFDDMNIIMIGLNPLLNLLSGSDLCNIIAEVPYLWHVFSLISMITYGFVLDGLRFLIKEKK